MTDVKILTPYNHFLSRPTHDDVAGLDALSETAETFIRVNISDNTRKAYRADLAHFTAWGGDLPATSETVASYLAAHADIPCLLWMPAPWRCVCVDLPAIVPPGDCERWRWPFKFVETMSCVHLLPAREITRRATLLVPFPPIFPWFAVSFYPISTCVINGLGRWRSLLVQLALFLPEGEGFALFCLLLGFACIR